MSVLTKIVAIVLTTLWVCTLTVSDVKNVVDQPFQGEHDLSLRKKQSEFSNCQVYLDSYILGLGYEITDGDAYRDPRADFPYSHKKSCHKFRLARDKNIFHNGKLVTNIEELSVIGRYWESLHKDARWGGHFKDPNHFSFEHNGVK